MNPVLLDIAILIYQITKKYDITLSLTWVPREDNDEADQFSRIIDYDDWGIQPYWYTKITEKLGTPTIDRFADQRNRKCPRFNSRFYCPEAEAIDAFTQVWSEDINWLVPPLYLVTRTLEYLRLEQAAGILIVPIWLSAHYWPMVQRILDEDTDVVQRKMILKNIFQHYRNTASLFGSADWSSSTLAVALDYRQ